MLLGQDLKFKNKLCNLKLGTFFSALPGQHPGLTCKQQCRPVRAKALKKTKAFAFAGRLYFILREMTHDETATETQYQNDDGEHHGCGIRPVLYILLRRTQLKEYA